MAYFRGETYIWSGEDGLHLWNREGMDSWDNTGWCCDEDGQRLPGFENASGVSIPDETIDQLVMMRLAEILVHKTPQEVEKLIEEAIEVGNFGSNCLKRNEQTFKQAFGALKLERPERD